MQKRTPEHPIASIFLDRWSPRAFSPVPMAQADLLSVLEAARWAPSAYNHQPWRFVYALRDDAHWQGFLDLLVPFNEGWAKHASALIFVLSDTLMESAANQEPSPSRSHSFDTGAAWAQLALQATQLGYQARGMAGVDFEKAQLHLNVPGRYRIEMAVALGKSSDPAILPDEFQKGAEENLRRPVHEIAHAGTFAV